MQDPAKFVEAMDGQIAEPVYFRSIHRDLWSSFMERSINKVLDSTYPLLNFVIATGLQYDLYDGTHKSCFFVWNDKLALDYMGKPLNEFRFLWYPSLSPKLLQAPVLKPIE